MSLPRLVMSWTCVTKATSAASRSALPPRRRRRRGRTALGAWRRLEAGVRSSEQPVAKQAFEALVQGRARRRNRGQHGGVQEHPAAYAESPRPLRHEAPAHHVRSLIPCHRNVADPIAPSATLKRRSDRPREAPFPRKAGKSASRPRCPSHPVEQVSHDRSRASSAIDRALALDASSSHEAVAAPFRLTRHSDQDATRAPGFRSETVSVPSI